MVNRIISKITEMGLSCSAVEKKLGFGNGAIRRFETSSPSVDKILRLSNFLNVSVGWLITGNDIALNFGENEKDFLEILNNVKDEKDKIKLIGCADSYAKTLPSYNSNNKNFARPVVNG